MLDCQVGNEEVEKAFKKYPDTIIYERAETYRMPILFHTGIAAHFGLLWYEQMAEISRANSNIYFEFSGGGWRRHKMER